MIVLYNNIKLYGVITVKKNDTYPICTANFAILHPTEMNGKLL